MKKVVGILALTIGVTMSGWAARPCAPIAQACKQAGYYKGGMKEGKGLIENCIVPITNGNMTLPNTSFSADLLQSCKATIAAKMQQRQQQQGQGQQGQSAQPNQQQQPQQQQ